MNTAKVEPGSTVAVLAWGYWPVGDQGAVMAAERIIAIDINDKGNRPPVRRPDFISPKIQRPIQDVIVELTDGGVDYSFECIGNVNVMRSALECCKGWGESIIIGVAGAGEEIAPARSSWSPAGSGKARPSVASRPHRTARLCGALHERRNQD